MTEGDRLLNEAEAARFLGVEPLFLRTRRVRGGGPKYMRLGHRTVRYAPADLREWLRERTFVATTEERKES
ncbi:MAG: hypothetical protein AMXMBFR53_41990 [Gemmatimonadota bacterium]